MASRHYTWDRRKAAENLRKHGVAFPVAVEVFDDPDADTFPDEAHSDDEERFITIGVTRMSAVLYVVHTSAESAVVRIISARRATRSGRRAYYGQR